MFLLSVGMLASNSNRSSVSWLRYFPSSSKIYGAVNASQAKYRKSSFKEYTSSQHYYHFNKICLTNHNIVTVAYLENVVFLKVVEYNTVFKKIFNLKCSCACRSHIKKVGEHYSVPLIYVGLLPIVCLINFFTAIILQIVCSSWFYVHDVCEFSLKLKTLIPYDLVI